MPATSGRNWPAIFLGSAFLLVIFAWCAIELGWLGSNDVALNDSSASEASAEEWDEYSDDDPELIEIAKQEMDRFAHPDDVQKPPSVEGVSDEELEQESTLDVVEILEACETIAYDDESPRYLFQLGRAALIHDQQGKAVKFLSEAASRGSAAAFGYLAFTAETDGEALSHLQSAIEGGFAPANQWIEEFGEVVQENVVEEKRVRVKHGEFAVFYKPDFMKAFYEQDFTALNADRFKSHAYVSAMLAQLNDNTQLFFLDAEDRRALLRLYDRGLPKIYAAKATTDTLRMKDNVMFALGAIEEAASGLEKASNSNASLEQGFRQTVSPYMVRMAEPQVLAEHGKQDAISLAELIPIEPEMAEKIFVGIKRYINEYK